MAATEAVFRVKVLQDTVVQCGIGQAGVLMKGYVFHFNKFKLLHRDSQSIILGLCTKPHKASRSFTKKLWQTQHDRGGLLFREIKNLYLVGEIPQLHYAAFKMEKTFVYLCTSLRISVK